MLLRLGRIRAGQLRLRSWTCDSTVEGADPLSPFGPLATRQVLRTDGFANVADLMINSGYDAQMGEVAASSRWSVRRAARAGRRQPLPAIPDRPHRAAGRTARAEAVHRVLRGWLAELGQPAYADGAEVVTRGSAGNVGGLAHHDAEHVGDGGQAGHLQVRGRDR
ncbi:MAG: hypothetical protein M3500_15965 [Actinomycetota bacterium]|nr:hypothetical protein [Actinomycetota bacterium]